LLDKALYTWKLIVKLAFYFRKYHKWLALIVGIQVLIWGLSGLYMTAVHIDNIHGNHLVKPQATLELTNLSIKPLDSELLSSLDGIKNIHLTSIQQMPVYLIRTSDQLLKVNAVTLEFLPELDVAQIRAIANRHYAGENNIRNIELLARHPAELGGRKQPIWVVEYDDWLESSLYFTADTGQFYGAGSTFCGCYILWITMNVKISTIAC